MLIEVKDSSLTLDYRRKQWAKVNKARFAKRDLNTTNRQISSKIAKQPPEYLRKIIRDHGDMSTAQFRAERMTHANALQYLPQAIFKCFENIPQPYELQRRVNVLYHTTGAITFIEDTPKVIPQVYLAQWASIWIRMRREKNDRRNFSRVSLPPFDNEEPFIDYGDNLQVVKNETKPIELDLDENEDAAVFDWLYSSHQPLRDDIHAIPKANYSRYKLSVPIMSNLYRLSRQFLHNNDGKSYTSDPNLTYLFNRDAFITAKSLSCSVPSGPSFEPLFPNEIDTNWTEFNDINKLITRRPTATEYKIALPYVYNNNPRSISFQVNQYPLSCAVLDGDNIIMNETNPFSTDISYFPVKHESSQYGFNRIPNIRLVNNLKTQYNIQFLQALTMGKKLACIDRYMDEIELKQQQNQNQQQQLPITMDELNQIADEIQQQPMIEPKEPTLQDANIYGDNYYEYLQPSYSRYFSDDTSYYPTEFMLTTAFQSPYYQQDPLTINNINQKIDLNYYIYPNSEKSLWQETVFDHQFNDNDNENNNNTDNNNTMNDSQQQKQHPAYNLLQQQQYDPEIIITDIDFDLIPIFDEFQLYEQTDQVNTLAGLLLYQAPAPFNRNHGSTVPLHQIDLVKNWYIKQPVPQDQPKKVKLSYQKLLKQWILNQIHNSNKPQLYKIYTDGHKSIIKYFSKSPSFQRTTIEWLEASIQVLRQGHNMLSLLIKHKRVEYLHLDYNFTLQATRVLTTKERKHSRFGSSFHLIREILRLLKIIVDLHIRHRLGDIDAFQLADGLQYTFSHVGILTGIYQFKYRTTHQIRQTKDLKHLIYSKFNAGLAHKGHGVGFWQPSWRVWLFWLQGISPLLQKWTANLLSRHWQGRQYGEQAQTITKQRVESVYDSELKKRFTTEIIDMMPHELRQSKIPVITQHLSDAWRCWRSGKPWKVPGMPPPLDEAIRRFVKTKADHWVTHAYRVREQLKRGDYLEKTVVRKNLGRLTRLALKGEYERQLQYLSQGPLISFHEADAIITTMSHWLESRSYISIPSPPINYKNDNKILTLSLEKLKEQYTNNTNSKISALQRKELTFIQAGFDDVDKSLARIKGMILNQRNFKEIEIEYYDEYNVLTPVYTVDPEEKITDMYLDQYLWFEAHRRGLFPEWIKPGDSEPAPYLVYKTCTSINNSIGIWDTNDNSATVLVQTQFSKLYDNIDLTLLNRLLCLIVDPVIADYITARYNSKLTYKDISYVNSIGIIRGIAFSSFITQYYGLVMDLLVLGLERASQLAGPPNNMNKYGTFTNSGHTPEESLQIESSHPIRLYCRYIDKVYILFKFDGDEAQDLIQDHLQLYPDPNNNNIHTYNNRTCWPRDSRMRLMRNDCNLGKATFYHIKNRIPISLSTIEWKDSFVSVYSNENPQLLFDMMGFEIRLIPVYRENEEFTTLSIKKAEVWSLQNRSSGETTAYAYIRVQDQHVKGFSNKIRHMLMTSGNAPYIKIAQKWNSILTSLMTYYREAVPATPELLELIIKCENKVQTRIKVGMNSKMPQRFPPVVFYSPVELGGLGMLSMGNILVPQSDRMYGTETSSIGVTHFKNGMNNSEHAIPALYRYIRSWATEFTESERVWAEYTTKTEEAKLQDRRLGIADIQSILDQGLPRINTLFSKDRQTLWFDKGWRTRLEWKKYTTTFQSSYWWTNPRHDGKLWNLSDYRTDVVQALGGVESILEHTLFKATYFKTWEGVFWEKKQSFEDSLKLTRLTKAQSQGLTQAPNRRFSLWWSPTINRADVYIGYMVQLDLTGIFMHGKLPVLKSAYVQIFRAHLWQKIHESIVSDLAIVLDQQKDILGIATVEKESIPPRKSYRMQSSTADLKITSHHRWDYTIPSLTTTPESMMTTANAQQAIFWFDILLRWGDYDQHDIESYARGKYLEYTSDQNNNIYPSQAGLLIAIDLTYNTWAGYGNYIPSLAPLIIKAMAKIMKSNAALYILRERVRKQVQLYTSEPTEPFLNSSNYGEIFKPGIAKGQNITWFIDSAAVYRVISHRTEDGNTTTKPINGALIIFNPTNGQLFLKIIHASAWQGQKRLTQLALWKVAEETLAVLQASPESERPSTIIMQQKSLLDPMQSIATNFPNLVLKCSDLSLPLQSILKLPQIANQVLGATESRLLLYNLYDEWLKTTIQAFTCFSRLLLLLRGFHIHQEQTRRILYPNATTVKRTHDLWPTLDSKEWSLVESQLRDLILSDFAIKNGVSVQSLTQSETRDIILGAQIQTPTEQREQLLKELETSNNNDTISSINVKTTDKYGNIVVTAASSNYERSQFISSNDWRIRALSSQQLHHRTKQLLLHQITQHEQQRDMMTTTFQHKSVTYVLPSNLIKQLVQMSDIKSISVAYMYGQIPRINSTSTELLDGVRTIQALIIPPQYGTQSTILYAYPPSNNPTITPNGNNDFPYETSTAMIKNYNHISNLIPCGLIYTIGPEDCKYMSPEQCIQHIEWYDFIKKNNINNEQIENLTIEQTTTISISYTPGSCTLSAFSITPQGRTWYNKSPSARLDSHGAVVNSSDYNTNCFKRVEFKLSDIITGYCLCPFTAIWNYAFMQLKFSQTLPYLLHIAQPINYYHSKHRKQHFISFVRSGQQQQSMLAQQNNENDAIAYDQSLNQLEDEFFQ